MVGIIRETGRKQGIAPVCIVYPSNAIPALRGVATKKRATPHSCHLSGPLLALNTLPAFHSFLSKRVFAMPVVLDLSVE